MAGLVRTDNSVELRTYKRATGELPEMESTKQLVRLVGDVLSAGRPRARCRMCGRALPAGLKRLDPEICYYGVDATAKYIDFAKQHFAGEQNITFARGDIFRLANSTDAGLRNRLLLQRDPASAFGQIPIRNLTSATLSMFSFGP